MKEKIQEFEIKRSFKDDKGRGEISSIIFNHSDTLMAVLSENDTLNIYKVEGDVI